MIGTEINGRYRIEAELGRGGMGVVYRGRDLLLKRPVAVKVVGPAALGTEGRARLLREAQAAARLNQANIVAVYDAGETELPGQGGHSAFVVMELVEGRTLRDYQPADLTECVAILQQVCAALEAAHGQEIIHRDLKAENVIRSADGQIKLMDFGLARTGGRTRLTQEGTLMGTFDYMAPELIQGQEGSVQTDLYALGVLAYELLAGRRPFEADSPVAVLAQHLHAPPTPPSAHNKDIPPALDHLVVRLLSKRPEDRPASAAAVVDALVDITEEPPAPRSLTPGPRLDFLVRGRLVSRERELAQALDVWQQAAAGSRQVLFISGEPGIGKTRLAMEIVAQAQVRGGQVLQGTCFENGGLPYMPVTQLIRAAFAGRQPPGLPPAVMADLSQLAPELGSPEFQRTGGRADDDLDENRLLESVALLCQLLVQRRPLVLFFDDLHWADSGSLAVLRHLARRLPAARLMILATYRELELTGRRPVRQVLDDLRREAGALRLKLGRLDREGTGMLLATLLAEQITPEFLEAIYRETEGNPFFVEEMCKALVERGALTYEAGHWQRPVVDQIHLPQSIQLTIESRLEQLAGSTLDVLRAGAMLGREFRYQVLRAALGLPEGDLVEALDDASRAQLIRESAASGRGSGPAFSFTHALIQATLLNGLGLLRRQLLARRQATALEELAGQEIELAPLVGRLFAEAGDGQRAAPYLLRAGDAARRLFAYDEAIESYERALLSLRQGGDQDRIARVLMTIGATCLKASRFERSRQAYDEAFRLWRRTPGTGAQAAAPATRPFRGHTSEPVVLDPTRSSDTSSAYINCQIFEGMVELGPDDEVLPAAASSWEVLDGGRRYVFHLRGDATWSDGLPVTAADFEYAWTRLLESESEKRLAPVFFDIRGARAFHEQFAAGQESSGRSLAGIRVVDRLTLEVSLEQPVAYFLHLVASTYALPVPRHLLERFGDRWTEIDHIVTNGPFRPVLWRPGQRLVLARNPKWRGSGAGNLEEVELDLTNDFSLLEEYAAGRLDCLYPAFLPGVDYEAVWRRFGADLLSMSSLTTVLLAFNCSRAPFDDGRVRRAVSLAINREQMAFEFMGGRHDPAIAGFIPPGMAGHGLGSRPEFDPEAGRRLLAEAGYPGGHGLPRLRFYEVAQKGDPSTPGGWISEQLAAHLGLVLELTQVTMAEMLLANSQGRPHLWYLGWSADYTDPDSIMREGNWPVHCRWPNKTFTRIVEEARTETDQGRRLALYGQAEDILAEEKPLLPLFYPRWHIFLKPWVRRFASSPTVWTIFKNLVLDGGEA